MPAVPSARRAVIFFAVAAALSSCRPNPAPTSGGPDPRGRPIVLITIDTLRADRVGASSSAPSLTPHLDRFAEGAARFTAAVTQAPLTLPAHATILTGLHPARHGARTNDGFRLAATVPTLTEALKAHGYRTGAFIGAYPLQSTFGLARGFDRYDERFLQSGAIERSADEVLRAGIAWIEEQRQAPFFAWLHLFDPHSPYAPPEPYAAAHAANPYDGEVAYTDAAIGRFFDRLRGLDLFNRATIVVMADHGESLGDHGERTHGTFVYDATIRIPLIIKLPDSSSPRTIDVPVEAADAAPTLATLAGTTLKSVDGHDLLPLLRGGTGDPERPAYAESYYQNVLLGWSPLRAVRTSRWKFIEAPRPELYDLASDPGERSNQIDTRTALANGMRRALPALDEVTPQASTASSEAAERLRSLGYVSGSTAATAVTRAIDPKDRVEVWAHIEEGIDRSRHDRAAAERAFRRALQLDPTNGLAMKYLADSNFEAGRLREARDGYRRAMAAGFRHPDVFVNLASIAERGGRLDEARDVLNEAVKLSSSDADAWNRLGLIEARRGSLDAARRAFTGAMAAAPDRAEPYYNLGVVERQAGNEAAAQSRLQEAIARNPAYAEAHYELGTGFLIARQPERALAEYRAALAPRPDYAEALFGAARAARDLGRLDEARRDYEHFIRVAPPQYGRQVAAAREALRTLGR
jgi:arylsulfatase A-like enzyme/Tfp pilus assembly protein PilF